MATPADIAMMTATLSAAFPNWKVSEWTNEVYYQDLKDIPADELMIAAQHCRAQAGRAFAPSTGEIRGAVMEIRRKAMNVPSAFDAWEELQTQIRLNGGDFGRPVWSSPLVERVVRQLGFRNLCLSENPTADRARFIQAYEQLEARALQEEMLIPEVRGYIEDRGGRMLEAPMDQIRKLADGMKK